MHAFILRRAFQSILTCLGVSAVAFILLNLSQDPVLALLPPEATQDEVEVLRNAMGLDKPMPVQFIYFMGRVVRGEFGNSFMMEKPAVTLVFERFPATLELAMTGLAFALLFAIPLGILAAVYRNSFLDTFCTCFAIAGRAMPIFWFGIMLIIVFAVQLQWLPVSGRGDVRNLIMPALTLGLNLAPLTMRLTRSRMIEVLNQDYIRTARSKGVPEKQVLGIHALRNAGISIAIIVGLQFGRLLGGSVVTETVFAWPGVGSLAVHSIYNADFPVVQAAIFFLAIFIVSANTLADIVVSWLDPRISRSG